MAYLAANEGETLLELTEEPRFGMADFFVALSDDELRALLVVHEGPEDHYEEVIGTGAGNGHPGEPLDYDETLRALEALSGDQVVVFVNGARDWPTLSAMFQGQLKAADHEHFSGEEATAVLWSRGFEGIGETASFDVGEGALFSITKNRFAGGRREGNGLLHLTTAGCQLMVVPSETLDQLAAAFRERQD